jgi:toxin YoeB
MYQIEYDKKALKHIDKLENQTRLLKKLREIIEDIKQNPYSPKFKFELLKGNFSGYCSKRLDKKNRVIYKVLGDKIIVVIVSILGHYE